MPQYKDVSSVLQQLREVATDEKQDGTIKVLLSIVIEEIEKEPIADVLPRAEVEGLIGKIFEDLEMYMEEHKDYYVILSQGEFIELKNKYTKGGAMV